MEILQGTRRSPPRLVPCFCCCLGDLLILSVVSLVVRSRVAGVALVRVGLVVVDVAVDVDVLDASSGGRKAIPLPEADRTRTGGTPSRRFCSVSAESRWPLLRAFRYRSSSSSWSWWWAVCSCPCCPVGRRRRRFCSWPRRPWCPWCLPRREVCACDRTTLTLVAAAADDDAPPAAPAAVPDDARSRPRSSVPYLPPPPWAPPTPPPSACVALPLVSVLFLRRFSDVPLPFDHLMIGRICTRCVVFFFSLTRPLCQPRDDEILLINFPSLLCYQHCALYMIYAYTYAIRNGREQFVLTSL